MIDLETIKVLLASPEAHKYAHGALEAVGAFALAPKLLTALLPGATKAGHAVASTLLRIPVVGTVLRLCAPDFIKLFDDTVAALDKVLDAFRDALDEDIKKAAAEDAAASTPPGFPPAGQP